MMYALVLLLGLARLLHPATALLLTAAGIAAVGFENHLKPFGDFGEAAWFLGFFGSGMALALWRERIVYAGRYALIAAAALVLFVWSGHFIMLFPLAGAYLVIWFARQYHPSLDYARHFGDLSYGLYIYGWPSEQLVMWLSGGHAAWWQVFFGSLAVALPAAWLSWHLVEKRALRAARRPPMPRLAMAATD
jgi:peptidoglycan/LPS O-acetylase OafA/YrhL